MVIDSLDEDEPEDLLRNLLHQHVNKICLNWSQTNVPVSLISVGLLSEVLMSGLEVLSKDLEAFAVHAGRKTITPDDLLLAARKTPELQQYLSTHRTQNVPAKPRSRKKPG